MTRTWTGEVWVRSSRSPPQPRRCPACRGPGDRRDVQGLEVVVVGLDLRPVGDAEAEAAGTPRRSRAHLREGMQGARAGRRPGTVRSGRARARCSARSRSRVSARRASTRASRSRLASLAAAHEAGARRGLSAPSERRSRVSVPWRPRTAHTGPAPGRPPSGRPRSRRAPRG